jgi:hypothetical protein
MDGANAVRRRCCSIVRCAFLQRHSADISSWNEVPRGSAHSGAALYTQYMHIVSQRADNPLRFYIAAHTFIFMAIDTRLSNFYPLSIVISTTYSPNIDLGHMPIYIANVNYTLQS